ncbi:hypothetical protein DFH06DRAFT_1328031 [Mycena polygramma]|nr:hypothetical protein DFH06DRAFT_1328031 [Mycena polygramma]
MSIPLTFVDKTLLETTIVDPDGTVHYTTTTTRGFGGRKVTTITSATGVAGAINWLEKTFVINSVQREVKDIKSRSGGVIDGLGENDATGAGLTRTGAGLTRVDAVWLCH